MPKRTRSNPNVQTLKDFHLISQVNELTLFSSEQARKAQLAQTQVGRLVGGKHGGDLLLPCLQAVIFEVDPRSATPIAVLMREDMSEDEIFKLIEKHNAEKEKMPEDALNVPDNHGFFWKMNRANAINTRNIQLPPTMKQAIDKYRSKYAEELRDSNLRDIDVLYVGEQATIHAFKIDQEKVIRAGGKLYNIFPMNTEKKTIGMSIIASTETLMRLFPIGQQQHVILRVNTFPAGAAPKAQPKIMVTLSKSESDLRNKAKIDEIIENHKINRTLRKPVTGAFKPELGWWPYSYPPYSDAMLGVLL